MSKSVKEIAWIAALLEGEGYFGIGNGSPKIQIAMTDLDVVERAKNILDSTKIISAHEEHEGKDGCYRKTRYSLTLTGNIAIQWMMTIYCLMGLRRKAKILEILLYWKKRKSDRAELLAATHLVKLIMKKTGRSKEESERIYLESLVGEN